MKKIPDFTGAVILKPAEMNKIHFGGIHTPLSAERLKEMAKSDNPKNSEADQAGSKADKV